MAILAHPDDESFAMGGTLAKLSHQNWQVFLLCATRGEAGIEGVGYQEAGRIRERELQLAAKHLGISVDFLNNIDGTLANIESKQLIEDVKSFIEKLQPEIILTFGPDGLSSHPDHVAISDHVTKAVTQFFPNITLLYIAPSEATVLGCGVSSYESPSDLGRIVVNVSEYKLEKVKAIQAHVSQEPPLKRKAEEEVDQISCVEHFMVAQPGNNLESFEKESTNRAVE